ncbi:hypothetical protein CSPX01_08139 [Colletotrichum filicis]|nr:hypothetical protein CSPX01_08139 [Colletotrichum filicis]
MPLSYSLAFLRSESYLPTPVRWSTVHRLSM